MIIVTGATGQLGRGVTEELLKRLPPEQIGVSVRDPGKASDLAGRGVRVRQGDFADPESLHRAFEGATQVLIVSVNRLGEEALWQHGNAIQAAKEVGAERILYTSHQAASPSSAFPPARDHAATEALMQASGLAFVSLRNGFYAESALYQLGGLRETGRLALPADGPVSWTARADLAVAAAEALTDPGLFDGISPPLTGSEALTFADLARIASEVLGRGVTRAVVDDDEYRAGQLSHGHPGQMVEMLQSLFLATRNGEFDVVDPALGALLGREPTPMREVLAGALAAR